MSPRVVRYPFYVGITTLIVAIVVVLTGLFMLISHRETKAAALQMADRLFSEINAKTMERYESELEAVAALAGYAAQMPAMAAMPVGGGLSHPGLDLMIEALTLHDHIFSTYVGYDDGSFIQVVALRDQPDLHRLFGAPADTAFVLRSISANVEGQMMQRWHFLNRQRQVTAERPELDPGYDPRARPWYIQAHREDTAFFTEPYIFSSTRLPGITCAEKLQGGGGVFGVDITLKRFSNFLESQKLSANGALFLFDRSGRIIAHPGKDAIAAGPGESLHFISVEESGEPLLQAIIKDYWNDPEGTINRTREIRIGSVTYLVRAARIKAGLKFDQILASVAPVSDFTGHIQRMQRRTFFFSGLALLLFMPLVLLVSRKITGSLTRLERESRKIRQRDFSESSPSDSAIKEIHSLIQAFVLMKRTIRRLLEQRRKLFDDFTKLIAGAIDAKSSYTGAHCARVPRVAEMLADAACEAQNGSLADFSMRTEDERWEFEVAAWLHDCGKVTTPEYVVDKATKLDTLYNRIHEIRMRFEVLLRDAQIAVYRRRLGKECQEAALQAELEGKKRQIAEDFAFVAECNIGGEHMSDGAIERLKKIGGQTWTRHLDDRLGISQAEAALKNRMPAPPLPVVEQVLADKPEHVVPRTDPKPFGDNPHGFSMQVPKHRSNAGELYNLSIRKGTLSPEDRFTIKAHIIQTISMLNQLEFPDYLANVPEFAGAHHETMIGTGYPRGLKKEEIPIPARIIAIADVFEALTAADRPYKEEKTLSEALEIMSTMRDDQTIDAELFDLFLQSGVYRKFAEQYLNPAQVDEVDLRRYVSAAGR